MLSRRRRLARSPCSVRRAPSSARRRPMSAWRICTRQCRISLQSSERGGEGRSFKFGMSGLACLVQAHCGANEGLQRSLVDLLALVEIDGTPGVALETRVEEAGRILEVRPFGEGHLHDALISLARADDSVVRPHRNASPLPLLDDPGIGLLDEAAEPAERRAPPVGELLDSRVDQL